MRTFCALVFAFCLWIQCANASCPNWCNKRGVCSSPQEDAGNYCICNMGFAGDDCSQRLCPAAFDPIGLSPANSTNRRTVRLETGLLAGVMEGKVEFSFGGSTVFFDADARKFSGSECTKAFATRASGSKIAGFQSATDVSCTRESVDESTGTGSWLISLNWYPIQPYMSNLVHHDGNPRKEMFQCGVDKVDVEEASGPFCQIIDVTTTGLPLYKECSNHGTCDRISGTCACENGFRGIACNDTRDSTDILVHAHDGPFFTASLLKVRADRKPSAEFNVLQTMISGKNVTTLRGDGLLSHAGDLHLTRSPLQGGHKPRLLIGDPFFSAGLVSPDGSSGGSSSLSAISAESDKYIGSLQSNLVSHLQSNELVQQRGVGRSSGGGGDIENHVLFLHDNNEVYSIDASGNVHQEGSLYAANGSFFVDNNLVTATHLKLMDNLDVSGSATIEESLTIGSGFALTPGGMTVDVATHTGTLFELRSRQSAFNGSMLEIHSVGAEASMIKAVSNGVPTFELTGAGDLFLQSLHMHSGGVRVDAGGVQVEAGGLTVKGGITLLSGALTLEGQDVLVGTVTARSGTTSNNNNNNDDNYATSDYVSTERQQSRVNLQQPLLLAEALNGDEYAGNLLELRAVSSLVDNKVDSAGSDAHKDGYSFIACKKQSSSFPANSALGFQNEKSIFEVTAQGDILSDGGAVFSGLGGVDVQGGPLRVGKSLTLPPTTAILIPKSSMKSEEIGLDGENGPLDTDESIGNVEIRDSFSKTSGFWAVIPFWASFAIIPPLPTGTGNGENRDSVEIVFADIPVEELAFSDTPNAAKKISDFFLAGHPNHPENGKREGAAAQLGRVVVVSNLCARKTSGELEIPAGSTVMAVSNGERWVDIEALKAPVNNLKHVRALEAENDLNIGNFTLTAQRLQAKQLTKNRLVIAGYDGLLTGSEKLTFAKGVLSTPSIKFDKLQSSFDARGNDISNAQLTNAKLSEATISALSISIPSATSVLAGTNNNNKDGRRVGGLAYFTAQGELRRSTAISYDDSTKALKLSELHGDLDGQGHILKNISVKSANFSDIAVASVKELDVSGDVRMQGSLKLSGLEKDMDFSRKTLPKLMAINQETSAIGIIPDSVLQFTTLKKNNKDNKKSSNKEGEKEVKEGKDEERASIAVSIETLSAKRIIGKIDGSETEIANVLLTRPSILNAKDISTEKLTISDLQSSSFAKSAGKGGKKVEDGVNQPSARVVTVAENGQLQASEEKEIEEIHIPFLSVESLSFVRSARNTGKEVDAIPGIIDFDGKIVKNLNLDGISLTSGSIDKFQTVSMTVKDLSVSSSPKKDGRVRFVTATAEGGLAAPERNDLSFSPLEKKLEVFGSLSVTSRPKADSGTASTLASDGLISAEKLQITSIPSAELLKTDGDGNIQSATDVNINSLTAKTRITVSSGAKLSFSDIRSTALAVDAEGNIVPLSVLAASQSKADGASDNITNEKTGNKREIRVFSSVEGGEGEGIEVENLKTVDASVSRLKVREVLAQSVVLTASDPTAQDFSEDTQSGGTQAPKHSRENVLILDNTGRLTRATGISYDESQKSLHVNSIHPHTTASDGEAGDSAQRDLELHSAHISNGKIVNSYIQDATSISTHSLVVKDSAEFLNEVVVDSTLTVHGTVIGSGPYVDSSDRRFKTDIQALSGDDALQRVMKLNAVGYNFRTNEYPDRKFSGARQIGYLADDVLSIAPELVSEDAEGFQAVAYSRVNVLVAAALQEVKKQTDAEMTRLRSEVDELKRMVAKLVEKTDRNAL